MTEQKTDPESQADNPRQKPDVEAIVEELLKAENLDELLASEGVLKQVLGQTLEQMLQGELTEHLGYERYEAKGRNSGNNRNGTYPRTLQTSNGEIRIEVPRDRNGEFEPRAVRKYETASNELEDKVIAMYAKGMTVRDIQAMLYDLYGANVSASMVSTITDKVWPLVEEWQNRPLETVYPVVFMDAIHLKIRQDHQVQNVAVYVVMGITREGKREILGHWIGDGAEGAQFWLAVLNDIKARGTQDIFIASVDGLTGFADAIETVFPQTRVQRCIIHQIRSSLKYVGHNDRKAFVKALKAIYQAATREAAQAALLKLAEAWGKRYPVSVRSWQDHWEELATFFDFGPEIRRLIYTTNGIEAYHRQLRKVTKNRGAFPTPEAARKLLYLAHRDIAAKWSQSVFRWTAILNELAIHFEDRLAL